MGMAAPSKKEEEEDEDEADDAVGLVGRGGECPNPPSPPPVPTVDRLIYPHGGTAANGVCSCGGYLYKVPGSWWYGCVKCGGDAHPVDCWRVGANETGIWGVNSEKKFWASRGFPAVPRGPSE